MKITIMNTSIPEFVGFVLFALSEILPLINSPANGVLHGMIIGFSKAFNGSGNKTSDVDIEKLLQMNKDLMDRINAPPIPPVVLPVPTETIVEMEPAFHV